MGLINFMIVAGFVSYMIATTGLDSYLEVLEFKVKRKWLWYSAVVWLYILWGLANLVYAIFY